MVHQNQWYFIPLPIHLHPPTSPKNIEPTEFEERPRGSEKGLQDGVNPVQSGSYSDLRDQEPYSVIMVSVVE